MRHVFDYIASALAQGAAKLCHVWLVTRRDGAVLGFSDHDRPLTFLGHACPPMSALTAGASRQVLGFDASDAAVSGVIDSDIITAVNIAAGLYDEAVIQFYTVAWDSPDDYVMTGSGTLMRLECRGGVADGASFIAHAAGPAAQLDRVIGRRFGFLCDAVLGDARCGLTGVDGQTCDKRYRTCLATFHNSENFRGFPDLPGEDFLTVYPRTGDVLDGGSRGQSSGR